jgi:transposase
VRGSERGVDGGKTIDGRTRRRLVETLGLLQAVTVHSAGRVDCRGASLQLHHLPGRFPRLRHLFAESASRGPLLAWIQEHLGWDVESVPKPERGALKDGALVRFPAPNGGFQVQCHRWKLERTLGWLIRSRRLARDDEGLPSSCEALIPIASICLFLTRLTPFRSFVTCFRHALSQGCTTALVAV